VGPRSGRAASGETGWGFAGIVGTALVGTPLVGAVLADAALVGTWLAGLTTLSDSETTRGWVVARVEPHVGQLPVELPPVE
jgi:hypothetical protein